MATHSGSMSSRPPVLIVTAFYPPSVEVGALRPHRFAKYLERLGHRVTVLSAGPSRRPVVNSNIHRLRGDFEDTPPLFAEKVFRQLMGWYGWGMPWSWRTIHYARKLLRANPGQVVFTTAPPAVTHWIGLWLKRWHDVRWIADFRDPLPASPPWMKRALERATIHHADIILANNDIAARMLQERYPHHQAKIHVIYNGFDPEEDIRPLRLPARSYKVLAHAGAIYGTRSPGKVLHSVSRLIEQNRLDASHIRIQLIGPVAPDALAAKDVVEKLKSRGCLECIDRVPREEALAAIQTSDYLLLLDMLGPGSGMHIPAKVFEYVRIGRPILVCTGRHSATARMMELSQIPHRILYPDDAAENIDQKVLDFFDLPTVPVAIPETFAQAFSALPQAQQLSTLLLEVTSETL